MAPPLEPLGLVDAVAQAGRQHANAAVSLTSCFKDAYTSLVTSSGARCVHMNDEDKRRLALGLARCHLASGGRATPTPCVDSMPLLGCLSHLEAEAFQTYTLYTTHVDNLCYYLDSHMWRDETSDIIQRLITGANDTAHVLAALLRVSSDLRSAHARVVVDTQVMHTSLLANLSAAQHDAARRHDRLMQGVKEAEERAQIISQVISRVAEYSSTMLYLQGFIVTNVIIFQSLAYYIIACVAIWLLTASPQTMVARFPCTAGIIIAACLESLGVWLLTTGVLAGHLRSFTSHRASLLTSWPQEYMHAFDASTLQWSIRAAHVLLCAVVVTRAYARYVDHAERSHALLLELRQRLQSEAPDTTSHKIAASAERSSEGPLQLIVPSPSPDPEAASQHAAESSPVALSVAGFSSKPPAVHSPPGADSDDPAEAANGGDKGPAASSRVATVPRDTPAPVRTRRRRGSTAAK